MTCLRPGKLRRNNHLISLTPALHPFSKPLLRLSELVVNSGVNEVPALRVKVVEHFEGGRFRTFAQHRSPGIAEVHGAKAERGDFYPGGRGEDAMSA
jgi:hypothetical protein